ncbi:MAG: hypothetical protein J1D86_05320 [Alistipes sp.]|nr:hypothetical protein [Alistipes sp.]
MKYGLLLLAGVAAFSCAKDSADSKIPESPYLEELTVSRAALAIPGEEEDDTDTDTGSGSDTKPEPPKYNGEEIFDLDFKPGDIIYVSQRTRSNFPFSKNDTGSEINPIYVYQYYTSDASWEDGYNFKPKSMDKALDWEEVRELRSVGNGFVLCAMYYPGDGKEGTRAVPSDQRSLTNLLRADIQAAYHSTSALYSRVRFKLYHVMNYFKINLYVPVFKETGKEGEDQLFSGYTPASLINAWVKKACPEFLINWSGNISSDTSPGVEIANEDHKADIAMYSHGHAAVGENSGSDGDDGDGDGSDEEQSDVDRTRADEPELAYEDPGEPVPDDSVWATIRPLGDPISINVKEFLPDELAKIQPLPTEADGSMVDEVYLFSFSVIIPAQPAAFTNQFPGWMQFQFKEPTETTKNYYFNSQFVQNGTLQATKGTLQIMNLYLPRKGDEVILINADIKPWTDVETDMNLPEKKDDKK